MKKGFTLVELLAVIAMLAILVIIALPNVIGMFNTAKESSFVTECQNIYKVAEQTYIQDSLYTSDNSVYSSNSLLLDLSGRDNIEYYVRFDKSGQIVQFVVYDGTYQLIAGYDDNIVPIKSSEFGVSTSNAKYKSRKKTIGMMLPATIPDTEYVLGDVDRNGKVERKDKVILEEMIKGNVEVSVVQKMVADVNGDNKVDTEDVKIISDHIEGKSTILDNKVKYKVLHYQAKLGNISTEDEIYYDLVATDNVEAINGKSVRPATKNFKGFNSPSVKTVTVSNGTVVKYFYTRKNYTVNLTGPHCVSMNVFYDAATASINEEGGLAFIPSASSSNCAMGGPVTTYSTSFEGYYNQIISITISYGTNFKWYRNNELVSEGKKISIKVDDQNNNYRFETGE